MKTLRGTAGADVLTGSGNESFQLVGLGGNDTYTFRLFDYVVYPPYLPGVDTGDPKTYYVRDDVVEGANGGIDTVKLVAYYNPVGFTGIYPKAIVSAAELANIETVTLASDGHSLWVVSTDDHANTVHGSTRGDTIDGNGGNDRLYGGGGGDLIDGGYGADILFGEGGNDRLTDTSGDNRLDGGGGNDLLTTGAGRDALHGGDGKDQMNAGTGADSLFGDNGDDVMTGGAGADRLVGGAGFDLASYASAAKGVTVNLAAPSLNTGDAKGDVYSAVEGIVGSGHADTLTGDAKANRLDGGAGNDTLRGGGGNDQLRGDKGTDRLEGGAGNDQFFVSAGQGRDNLLGGAGHDVFTFAIDTKISTPLAIIGDFQDGQDSIRVTGVTDVVASAEQVGHTVVLTLGKFLDLGIFGTIFNSYGTITLVSADIDDITRADLSGVHVVHDGMTF